MTDRLRFEVTAMKYPGFYACREVEADSLDQAVALAKVLDWNDQHFEPTSDWPAVQSLLVESEVDSRLVDLESSPRASISVLREFVDDVKLAHGTGEGDRIDDARLDWPDLAATYREAAAVLACAPADPVKIGRTVYTAIYEHDYGTDVRVFRTEAQALAWRTELAKEWWENEFPEDERPPEEEIGARYFNRMCDGGNESFTIETCAVE